MRSIWTAFIVTLLCLLVPQVAHADDWAGCRSERADRAVKSCSAILAQPNVGVARRAEAFRLRGEARVKRDNLQRAIEDFNAAIALNPSAGSAYFARGRAFEASGQFALAKRDFERAARVFETGGAGTVQPASPKAATASHSNGADIIIPTRRQPTDGRNARRNPRKALPRRSNARPAKRSKRIKKQTTRKRKATRSSRKAKPKKKAKRRAVTKRKRTRSRKAYRKSRKTRKRQRTAKKKRTSRKRKSRAVYSSDVDLKRKGGASSFFDKLSEEGR